MRGHVGLGERRAVVLLLDAEAAAVHLHDLAAGLGGEVHHLLHEYTGINGGGHRPPPSRKRSRTKYNTAMLRASVQSSRATSSLRSPKHHDTTTNTTNSSPGRRCSYNSRAHTT